MEILNFRQYQIIVKLDHWIKSRIINFKFEDSTVNLNKIFNQNKIFYSLNGQSEIDFIKVAMKAIEDQTRTSKGDCIRFIPRSDEKPYLSVINGDGCYSYVCFDNTIF